MKILLIITDYGSFNNFLSEVAVKLANIKHQVHVMCSPEKVINYEDKEPYESMGITFHYMDFPRSFNPFLQLKASKRIHDEINSIRPDLINIHFTTAIFTTLLLGKPDFMTMGTIHGIGYPRIAHKIKRKIFETVEKFCFRRLDQIYLINRFDYNLVKELHPEKAFRYNSYGVGCDVARFNPATVSDEFKTSLRHSLSIKKEDFVLAFTGRFVAFKGFDIVIRTMIGLVKRYKYKNVKLLLIGGEDPAHPTGLNKKEEEFLRKNIQVIRIGFTASVNLYLSITDVFVFPSQKEGMPVCIMEALTMGVPVITSDTRGCNDLVEDHYNGYLLSEKPTVRETTGAVLKLYHNRELLRQMSANSLSTRNELTRDMYVDNQLHIYKSAFREDSPLHELQLQYPQ